MSSLATAASTASKQLSELLDTLPITDRIYHDLRYTQPLVDNLLKSLRDLDPQRKVLIVSSNTTLAMGLNALGHQVELWNPRQGLLHEGLAGHVARYADLDELIAGAQSASKTYDVVILPYVLEAAASRPDHVLEQIRELVKPEGRLVVAYRQTGALALRLRAFVGRSQLGTEENLIGPALFSWPRLARRRAFSRLDLATWARKAGLRVTGQEFVSDTRMVHQVTAMGLADWSAAAARWLLARWVPALRDAVIATLVPMPGSRLGAESVPTVSVIASTTDPTHAARLLERLAAQSYPHKRFEVILVRDASPADIQLPAGTRVRLIATERPYGPKAANLALAEATGEIVAFTDDRCQLPRGWIETGVGAMAGWTAAATGPLLDDGHYPRAFLTLPGARPSAGGERWFSSANTFFRKRAVLDAGGFDVRFDNRTGGRVGWDNELAYRLTAQGYSTRVAPTLSVVKTFTRARHLNWIGGEFAHGQGLARAVAQTPSLRREVLCGRVFAAPRTMWFDFLVAGLVLALATRRLVFIAFGLPWLLATLREIPIWPPHEWMTSVRLLRGIGARHMVWMLGLATGSLRSRRLVL